MRRRHRDHHTDAARSRLCRDSENGMIFGVCAGLADYFGFNVKITRICVAIGGFMFFPTVIVIYVIMALLLDDSPRIAREREREERRQEYDELRRRVRSEPQATLRSVRHRFRELDRRLQRLEKHVTSKKYRLQREFDGLRD